MRSWVLLDLDLSAGDDPGSIATRAVVLLLILSLSFLCAVAFLGAVRRIRADSGSVSWQLFRRPPDRAPWASAGWACGRCHSVNPHLAPACQRCRSPRAETEMAFAGVPTEPDVIPAPIPAGSGATVTLEHNPAAHLDGLNGHWRLRVNSVIVGSAARRDGALALLRAVEGADAVLYDAEGMGYAAYDLPSLIAAFEVPRLPLRAPCPEGRR